MSITLQCRETSKPHPEGVFSANCVDWVDLGLVEVEYQGQKKMAQKVRGFFETEYRDENGKAGLVSKTFTASLHPKAKLAEYLGKWRGRPVVPGETLDLDKLIGLSCTLVISHQQNLVGRTYSAIDAISKPTKKVTPSGQYDPVETRRRIADWKAREAGLPAGNPSGTSPRPSPSVPARPSSGEGAAPSAPKSAAPVAAPTATADFDPEVGF